MKPDNSFIYPHHESNPIEKLNTAMFIELLKIIYPDLPDSLTENEIKSYLVGKKVPDSSNVESGKYIHRKLVKLVKPFRLDKGTHELAVELNAAKEKADSGDNSALESLYKRLCGGKGNLKDIYI